MSKLKFNRYLFFVLTILFVFGFYIFYEITSSKPKVVEKPNATTAKVLPKNMNPLSIEFMQNKEYPGSNLAIEETLSPALNYNRYVASYYSDGLKIYGLLLVPSGDAPKGGFPAIIFNHGYIPPEQYRTTERYIAYQDAFARNGYVVFKPDYRGNGSSEGEPEGAYYSPAYTTDVLNALFSVKKLEYINPSKIGMWGHSMGGNITLRSLVLRPNDIKAGVIWGGVVGSYYDLMNNWQRRVPYRPSTREMALRLRGRQTLTSKYGTPDKNPTFWNSLDPTYFTKDIIAPLQLHSGGSDEEVPADFSQKLFDKMKSEDKVVEYFEYPGDDHNISQNLSVALNKSVEFFDKYLK